MRISSIMVAVVALMLCGAQAASAQTFLYSYSGTDGSFSFTDSSTPTPIFSTNNSFGLNENGTVNNANNQSFEINFDDAMQGGGFDFFGQGLVISEFGQQLYAGSTSKPIFMPGDAFLRSDLTEGGGTFSVSAIASGVPEPSTWAMMLLGFGGLGFLAYRKARTGDAGAAMIAF